MTFPVVKLPKAEVLAPVWHEIWRQRTKLEGAESRISVYTGEELLVPWDQMAEIDKQQEIYFIKVFYSLLDLFVWGYEIVFE